MGDELITDWTPDSRAYVTREAAERRAERIRRSGFDDLRCYARVMELELCAEPTDADRLLADRTAWYLHAKNVEAENARLRELMADMWRHGMCACEHERDCVACQYAYPGRMQELGIEVSDS